MPFTLDDIRAAVAAHRILWRKHALDRARERGISRDQVYQVLSTGDIFEQDQRAKPCPKRLLMAFVEPHRPLYVAAGYDEQAKLLFVITVHWLDPKKWEDPWTRAPKRPRVKKK